MEVKINSEDGNNHGPVIKYTGPYLLNEGETDETDLIVQINDAEMCRLQPQRLLLKKLN